MRTTLTLGLALATLVFGRVAEAAFFQNPVAVYNNESRQFGPYPMQTQWNNTGKPDGLYFAIGGSMDAECEATITVNLGNGRVWTRKATRWQGVAFAFTGIEFTGGQLLADIRAFQSSGWRAETNGGNSQTAAIKAGESATGQARLNQSGKVDISNVRVTVTMKVYTSAAGGANATYLGASWNLPPSSTPPKLSGNIRPNKDYQRYPFAVQVTWTGRNSYAYRTSRMINGSGYVQVQRIPDTGKWVNPQDRDSEFAMWPQTGVYKIWGLLEGLNASNNWPNLGTCDVDYYVPSQTANSFSTKDDATAEIEGKARTRRDVNVTLTTGIGGIVSASGDPGEQTFSVLVTTNNRAKEFEINYEGVVLSADTSSWWSWGVPNWANGYYYGWPVNSVRSLEIEPDTAMSGFLNGATTVVARTALKAIRINSPYDTGSNWSPATAYEIGARANLEILPLASGAGTWSDSETFSFAQGQASQKTAVVNNENATVAFTLTNQYPYSYALAVLRRPDGQYKVVGSNHPTGGTSFTISLSSVLTNGESGIYNLYLLAYTPVDYENLGNAIIYGGPPPNATDTSYVTLPGLEDGGATLPFGLSQAEELVTWTPPAQSTAFTYGWALLTRVQFRYEGKIEIGSTTIIQQN